MSVLNNIAGFVQTYFLPSKATALKRTIYCVIGLVFSWWLSNQAGWDSVGCFFPLFFIYGAFNLFMFWVKADNDKRAAQALEQERYYEPARFVNEHSSYGVQTPPTTPGSGNMRIPDGPPPEGM